MSKPKHPAWEAAQSFSKEAGLPMPGDKSAAPAPSVTPAESTSSEPEAPAPVRSKPAARAAAPEPAPASPPAVSVDEIRELQKRLNVEADARARAEEDAARIRKEAEDRIAAAREETSSALTRQLQELQQQLRERESKDREREVDELLSPAALANAEHISPDAAKELIDRVLKPAMTNLRAKQQAEVESFNGRLKEVQDTFDRRVGELSEAQQRQARRLINEKILHAHTDFTNLRETREWKEFASRPIPGSRRTFGEEIAAAYAEGDSEYVIDAIQTFKSGKPRVTDVADIDATSTVAHSPAAPKDETAFSYADLTEWRYQMQRGEITKEQFKAKREAFAKAEKEGRVR